MQIYQWLFWIFLCLIGFETINWEHFIYPSATFPSVNLLSAGEKREVTPWINFFL